MVRRQAVLCLVLAALCVARVWAQDAALKERSIPAIPLQCSRSVSLDDILNLDPVIKEVNDAIYQNAKIRELISSAVLCESLESGSGARCQALNNWNNEGRGESDAVQICRRNYLRDIFAGNSDPDSQKFYNRCRDEISAGALSIDASYAGIFCHDLVRTSADGGVASFCGRDAAHAAGALKISQAQAVASCEDTFAYFNGLPGCFSWGSDQASGRYAMSCSALAKAKTASAAHNAALCRGSWACLAIMRQPSACQSLSQQIVSHFCSDWDVPKVVKEISLENAFRRAALRQPPFRNQEYFMAPTFLAQENQMRRNKGMQPFHIGDELISNMPNNLRRP